MNYREKLDREFTRLTIMGSEVDAKLKLLGTTGAGCLSDSKAGNRLFSDQELREYRDLQKEKQDICDRKQKIIQELNELLTVKNNAHLQLYSVCQD